MCNFVKEMVRVIISEIHCSGINFSFRVSLFAAVFYIRMGWTKFQEPRVNCLEISNDCVEYKFINVFCFKESLLSILSILIFFTFIVIGIMNHRNVIFKIYGILVL